MEMGKNTFAPGPRRRLSRAPTPHSLADDSSVPPIVCEHQPQASSISLDISKDMSVQADSARIDAVASSVGPDGLPVIHPRNGGASDPEFKLSDATNSWVSAQIPPSIPPLSDRLRLFASLSRMSAEEIEVARQTEVNTLNNHRFSAPTESERAAISATTVTGKRKSKSSPPPSPLMSSLSQTSASSPSPPTLTTAISGSDTPTSPSYLADDETEDNYASDTSLTGSPQPSSSSQVSSARGNPQKRRRLDKKRTRDISSSAGDQSPKSPMSIVHHQTAPHCHQKDAPFSSQGKAKKTVRFDESRNTVLDYDSSSTIALSDEDVYRMIHSGASSPPRNTTDRNPPSSLSSLDHGLMRSPWLAWSAELNRESKPTSLDTAPITSQSSHSSVSLISSSSSVDKKEEGAEGPVVSAQARATGMAQLWSPPRLRLSFSDISSANNATIAAAKAETFPSTPPLEDGSSPDPALWSSAPSSPIAPRIPLLQRYATLPMSSTPSFGSSDARLLLQYESLSSGLSEEVEETRQDETISEGQKDGHSSSPERSLLTRFHRTRLTSPPRRSPMKGEFLHAQAAGAGSHPYRRDDSNARGSSTRGTPPRLVRSASLSTPDIARTPSLRREASSTSLLDVLL
ncbi:hypothetical protein EMPS_10033 [Entomortierella parvispora]|uniref:Uncharacterized protein n=1 Tax=Entomortierella parvispora TaxID=205924 RepID=A0A9P3HJ30_9FUNG|nr:hypothetical protein EMPS_10033 [Entomortierella parvispora]